MIIKNRSAIIEEAGMLFKQNDHEKYWEGMEWIETNGLGGWSSSTVLGSNTRRYHGLLVAATKPPTERMNLVSKLDDAVVINNERFELGCNQYSGGIVYPEGYQYLQQFSKHLFPEWTYKVNGILLKKTIAMVYNENTVLLIYEVLKAPVIFTLELLPLIAAKGYHTLQNSATNICWDARFENNVFHNKPYQDAPDIYIAVPNGSYKHHPSWFYRFLLATEQYRGLDCVEDLFNHGTISVELKENDRIGIIISTQDPAGRNALELFQKEKERREGIIKNYHNECLQQLVLAADQFIVKRDLKTATTDENLAGATIIAGYHWFTDWGRDTMISLPGLCLSTGRYGDAKKIIAAFGENVSMGMLPNRFQDNNEPPEYNNVDGTLWYFIAIKKYLDATGDTSFILDKILPVLKDIIDWHFRGTRYNIHVDDDGLLYAGEVGQQLTWMDARVGDWVVTPRMGKPVEIQALWYNTLMIFAELLRINKQGKDAEIVALSAAKAKMSFYENFWYDTGNYLFDNIDENGVPDNSLRPNQLFALSLPYAILDDHVKAKAVLGIIEDKLYTPMGLRTLQEGDERYIAVYGGDQYKRDASYHQGTVWSWLLGPYIDAQIKVKSEKSKVKKMVSDFLHHLNNGCIGSISEIFDASAPHYPRGCIAQAWGVAELLRVIKDHGIG